MLAEDAPYIGLKKPSPIETTLSNGVIIYRSGEAFDKLSAVVAEFAEI